MRPYAPPRSPPASSPKASDPPAEGCRASADSVAITRQIGRGLVVAFVPAGDCASALPVSTVRRSGALGR